MIGDRTMIHQEKEFELKEHRMIKSIPWSETCFGCNDGPNEGIGMRAYISDDGYVVGVCETKALHQGFPGVIHGGLVGTYFDEVFWHATRLQNPDLIAMTVEMTTYYRKPVRPGMKIRIIAEPAKFEGRHIYITGYLRLPNDEIAATANIHYVTVRPENSLQRDEWSREKHETPMESISRKLSF